MKHLTIKEASELYKKHPDTIRTWIKKNEIQTTKDRKGRVVIKQGDLEAEWGVKRLQKPLEAPANAELIKYLKQTNAEQTELIRQLVKQQADQQQKITELMSQQANLLDQQQKLSGALLSIEAGNTTTTEVETPKKKHWWSK